MDDTAALGTTSASRNGSVFRRSPQAEPQPEPTGRNCRHRIAGSSAFAALGRERLRGGDSESRVQFLPCGDGDVADTKAGRRRDDECVRSSFQRRPRDSGSGAVKVAKDFHATVPASWRGTSGKQPRLKSPPGIVIHPRPCRREEREAGVECLRHPTAARNPPTCWSVAAPVDVVAGGCIGLALQGAGSYVV